MLLQIILKDNDWALSFAMLGLQVAGFLEYVSSMRDLGLLLSFVATNVALVTVSCCMVGRSDVRVV